jgi:hypothetical protein
VILRDLRGLPGRKVCRLRSVKPYIWWLAEREARVDSRFWSILQKSFYYSYHRTGVRFSEHRILRWGALLVSPGGVPILPYFERYLGLVAFLSDRSQYVREWSTTFYSTVFVEADRSYIQIMFDCGRWRMTCDTLARHFGLQISEDPMYLNTLAYRDAEPLRHAFFPPEEDVRILFTEPFLPGTLGTPDRLTPVAYTIHMALRRSLLFR